MPGAEGNYANRFIPACAGNTEISAAGITQELGRFIPACAGNTGVAGQGQVFRKFRFIPACAGNTLPNDISLNNGIGSSPRVQGTQCNDAPVPPLQTVHPRVCREHAADSNHMWPHHTGSSPRVQGTRTIAGLSAIVRRFIPACAGNTPILKHCLPQDTGSSPRVQGTPRVQRRVQHLVRFIPACAGNTNYWLVPTLMSVPVHPRVCREHPIRAFSAAIEYRFIPACAGNTAS